jgi:spore germination cell wall hydrolase CwlJ-like protein
MLTTQLNAKLMESWNVSILALCGWREARNQGRAGMTAVCWSVRNRVFHPAIHWWGRSWPGVILHPYQYSSFNHDDPNAFLLPADPISDPSWADALQAAQDVYTPATPDPTLGATHYYLDGSPIPTWANERGTVFTVQIGKHRFYKAS